MAIHERKIKDKNGKAQWEVTATGKDVHELKGHLRDAAEHTNEKNEGVNNSIGMIEMETADGKRDVVREDKARRLQRKGYVPTKKSFIVPELPWLKDKG
ncbi:MAG: hypothetical protein WBB48_13495 [Thermodesulfobacteriota bacterium]